jgi:hypothetical protein
MKKYFCVVIMALGVLMTSCCPVRVALYDDISDYNRYEPAGVDIGYIPYVPYQYHRYYYPQRRYYRAPSRRRYYRR